MWTMNLDNDLLFVFKFLWGEPYLSSEFVALDLCLFKAMNYTQNTVYLMIMKYMDISFQKLKSYLCQFSSSYL